MEYLLEADYTPKKAKLKYFSYVSSDILDKSTLSEAELVLCNQIGVTLLDGLKDVVVNSDGRKSPRNIFKIALHIDSDSSHKFILDAGHLLPLSSLADQYLLMKTVPTWKNGNRWEPYFTWLCESTEDNPEWMRLSKREKEKWIVTFDGVGDMLRSLNLRPGLNTGYLKFAYSRLMKVKRKIKNRHIKQAEQYH